MRIRTRFLILEGLCEAQLILATFCAILLKRFEVRGSRFKVLATQVDISKLEIGINLKICGG